MKEKGNMVLKPAERGESRVEYYSFGKTENFGLHKRTRRLRRGIACTKPDGTTDSKTLDSFGINRKG